MYSARHNATLSARRRSKAPAGPNDKVFASLFQKAAGDKRGRRPLLFCAARRKTRAKRAEIRSAQQKRPCQPKTAKRFFGGPGSQGPSGQAKERMRVLPARRDLLRLACRAVCRGWLFLRGLPLLCGLLRPVPRRVFPAAAPAAVCEASRRCARVPRLCFPARGQSAAFASGLRCRGLFAVCLPCACVCGAFAAAVWPVWLAAPERREVLPPGVCA